MHLPAVFAIPNFRLFWIGLLLSTIGNNATLTANLWQLQELTDSTLYVGLAPLLGGIALIVVGPLGGSIADRMDRKRLVQLAQGGALCSSAALSILTFTHALAPWHIYVSVLVMRTFASFENPARQALIPAIVGRERILEALSVYAPIGKLSQLLGPALAGLLISLGGAGFVYVLDVFSFIFLILMFAKIGFENVVLPPVTTTIWASIGEGFRFVRGRPLIMQLLWLDLTAALFTTFRVLLPSLARDVFMVGATGYGLLSAAPAIGALLGAGISYRMRSFKRKGYLVLGSSATYALAAMVFGYAPNFTIALILAGVLGLTDTLSQLVRQGVVLSEAPDHLRGRVTSVYQMVAGGGPALGQGFLGATAGALGSPLALGLGAFVPLGAVVWSVLRSPTVKEYEG